MKNGNNQNNNNHGLENEQENSSFWVCPVLCPCPFSNYYVIMPGDTLYKIALNFNVSIQDILRLNPGIQPENLQIGEVICIPVSISSYEIRISLSRLLLMLYKNGNFIKKYRIAAGKPSTPTPEGIFVIVNKQVNPGGPFGTRWMGLSIPGYGIHGTNNPDSIGTYASNGCIRMYNEDVEELFNLVSVGTIVRIFR